MTHVVDDPTQTVGDASPLPPHQLLIFLPLFLQFWAVCFEPNTALLLQDPLNHATYDPGKTLSRSIESLNYGDTVLAEKHGPDGRGN